LLRLVLVEVAARVVPVTKAALVELAVAVDRLELTALVLVDKVAPSVVVGQQN
jgi:hypothetical protein